MTIVVGVSLFFAYLIWAVGAVIFNIIQREPAPLSSGLAQPFVTLIAWYIELLMLIAMGLNKAFNRKGW